MFEFYYNMILYFFVYKTVTFYFPNNPKGSDPSYKTDLDLWNCFGRVKLVLQQELFKTDLVICSHS